MTASSQTPPGALPPELSPVRPPMTDAVRAAYAAYGVALPMPAGPPAEATPDVPFHLQARAPEPAMPECFTCGSQQGPLRPCPLGRRYPSGDQVLYCGEHAPAGVTTSQAAAAVMDATMKDNGAATGEQLADAERTAGILFDPASVQAAVDAAREQARTEYAAELAEVHGQLAAMAGARRQVDAVLRLCEGRRGDDLLLVSAIAAAAEYGSTALDGLPMTLAWSRGVSLPDGGAREARAIVECVSAYGGRAHLVLTGEERAGLVSLLDTEIRDIHAKCPVPGCGTAKNYDASDPELFGWSRLEVATLGDGPRWYCSDMCVVDALARAGHELAAADDLDARYGPGASDEYAMQVAEATEAGFEAERGDTEDGGL